MPVYYTAHSSQNASPLNTKYQKYIHSFRLSPLKFVLCHCRKWCCVIFGKTEINENNHFIRFYQFLFCKILLRHILKSLKQDILSTNMQEMLSNLKNYWKKTCTHMSSQKKKIARKHQVLGRKPPTAVFSCFSSSTASSHTKHQTSTDSTPQN